MSQIVMLKRVRLSNVYVFEKSEPMEEGGVAKYRCKFILEKRKQDDEIREAIEQACIDKFGEKAGRKLFDRVIDNPEKCCFREGDDNTDDSGEIREGFEGNMYIAGNATKKPLLIDRSRDEVGEEEGLISSGNYANVKIDIFAWEHKKSKAKGVSAQICGIQFVAEGDPLGGGGRRASVDDFEDEDDDGGEDDAPRGKKGKRGKGKDTGGKKKRGRSRDEDEDDEDEDEDDEDDAPRKRSKKRRNRD